MVADAGLTIAAVMIVLALVPMIHWWQQQQRPVLQTMTAQERLSYEKRKGELLAEQELRARQ